MTTYRVIDFQNLDEAGNRLLNEAAVDIHRPYTDLINGLYEDKEDNIDWLVSSTASRNLGASSLFIYCCYLAMIKRLLETDSTLKEIIVDSPALKKTLEEYFKTRRLQVNVRRRTNWKNRLKPAYNFFYNCFHFGNQFFRGRKIGQKDLNSQPITLMHVVVIDNSFGDHGYKDRYYPGFGDNLSSSELSGIYYNPSFFQVRNYSREFAGIKKDQARFVLKEQFLKFTDYLYALLYPWRVTRLKFAETNFMGFNITPLIKEEIKQMSAAYSSVEALLRYRFTMRLKEKNIRLKLAVEWFENLTVNRGAIAGYHKWYPELRVVGYQGMVNSSHFIFLRPSQAEKDSGVIPDRMYVIGAGLKDFAREYCPELDVAAAPAFRFKGVWRERKNNPDPDYFTILIALPIQIAEGLEILKSIAPVVPLLKDKKFRYWVKPHPSVTPESLKARFGSSWPPDFEFIGGDFDSAIEKSNLLISAGSSTCLETLAKGVPVIVMGSQSGLTHNPIPKDIKEDIWRLCYTADELLTAIRYYTEVDTDRLEEYKRIGESIREMFFEPVTDEGIRDFLFLNNTETR